MAFREPLLLPALFLAAGVALANAVEFGVAEALVAGLLFLALALPRTRARMAAVLLAWSCAGILSERLHRRGPPPELDAEPGETLADGGVAGVSLPVSGSRRYTRT